MFFVRLVGRPGANSDGALARDEKTIKNMGSSGQPAQLWKRRTKLFFWTELVSFLVWLSDERRTGAIRHTRARTHSIIWNMLEIRYLSFQKRYEELKDSFIFEKIIFLDFNLIFQ